MCIMICKIYNGNVDTNVVMPFLALKIEGHLFKSDGARFQIWMASFKNVFWLRPDKCASTRTPVATALVFIESSLLWIIAFFIG